MVKKSENSQNHNIYIYIYILLEINLEFLQSLISQINRKYLTRLVAKSFLIKLLSWSPETDKNGGLNG